MAKNYVYQYDKKYWPDYRTANSLEWVITNGLGSYGGGTLTGGLSRTHQAYLIASLHPPIERYVTLEMISDWLKVEGEGYDLETSQHLIDGKTVYKNGYEYLTDVSYDGTISFRYAIKHFTMHKTIALKRETNTVVIDYTLKNGSKTDATLVMTPWFNFREHNTLTSAEQVEFSTILTGDTLSLVPSSYPNARIDFSVSEGTYFEKEDIIDRDSQLQIEVDLETEGLCSHYTPYEIEVSVPSHCTKHVSVVCSVITSDSLKGEELLQAASDCMVASDTANRIISAVNEYYDALIEQAGHSDDPLYSRLVLDADHFIVKRESTGKKTILAGYPWFTDWGRDTMMAFTGLTLCTRRYEDAKEILETFADYLHNGMIPNMFPDNGAEPLYNSVDASLGYFFATFKLLIYTENDPYLSDEEKVSYREFVKEKLYPALKTILKSYMEGTDYSIYMLPNGLLHAGSNLDQITWMDVRVGDMVVTPRHGCPVEINALWYNAICTVSYLADRFANSCSDNKDYVRDALHYGRLAISVRGAFLETFWNPLLNYFNDVVDGDAIDTSFRPNQLIALALPFSRNMVPITMKRAVVDKAYKELYIGTGLRSLGKKDPNYHGQYRGALSKRDLSYHQGTAWAFLIGSLVTAYKNAYGNRSQVKKELKKILEPIILHMSEENCIGGICEIFEGDSPHSGRGCYTQAWSTGETLRAYSEDIVQ